MKHLLPSLTLAFALSATSFGWAQRQSFTVDPGPSSVKMILKTNHEIVNGTFHLQSGAVGFDRSDSKMDGSIVIAAGSGTTGNESRDKKMNKETLKSQQYTTVTFVPKSFSGTVAKTGDSTIQVTGVMTLLGAPHELTIPMQVHIDGSSCVAKSHFVVPYVEWGLKDPSFLVWKAEKQVDIDLNLLGLIS